MDAKILLENSFPQLVEKLQKTISFNTEKGKPADFAPFGKNVADCLHYVLELCREYGLETYDCDGYAGHADFKGSGNEVLGILGHLDVVPSKAEEWEYPPYGGVVADGKLYGRGAMDDKGPMIACLFAVKALKDSGFKPKKTIRLIFGCDEESGMQCVAHYFSKMPYPDVAFSPDGDFPVINVEKGIISFDVVCGKLPQGVTITAGERCNVVPSLCVAELPLDAKVRGDFDLCEKEGKKVITATGKSAHGSTPQEGVNAAHKVIAALYDAYPQNEALAFLAQKVCDFTGKSWGIALHDEISGDLTCNLGILRTAQDGTVTATVDVRFPASYKCDRVLRLIRESTPTTMKVMSDHASEPLYVPADSKLVATLMEVYNEKMNCDLKPLAIGGGTYSRCLPSCVAFGPLFPGEEQTIHMPDECADLENLKLMAELYLEAIKRLAT